MAIFSDPSGLIFIAFYFALLLLIGYTVICAIAGAGVRQWLEVIGLSFAVGSGSISLLLFLISLAGFKPGRGILIAIAIFALIGLATQWKFKRLIASSVPSPRGKLDALSLLGIGGLGLLIAAISNVIARAGWVGLSDIDAFAIWMLKAKVVALSPLRPIPFALTVPTLSYTHQDYPLSLPFLVAGLYAALGHIDDEQAKVLLLPLYLSLIAILYSAIRRQHRRGTALALTAIFAASPTLTQNASLLVAETPLLLAWTGAVAMLLRWLDTKHRGDLILCGLFTAFAAFTKNEGLALMPVIGLMTLGISMAVGKASALKDWALSAAISIGVIVPWLIYRTFLPKTHEDYGGKLMQPAMLLHNIDRLNHIISQFLGRIFDGPEVGLIWYLLILLALLGFRGFAHRPVQVLWIILLVQLSLYTATFIVTPWDLAVLIPMIGPKLLTQASPIAVFLIGLHLREIRWPERRQSS